MLVTMLGFSSFYFIFKYHQSHVQVIDVILSGIFAGLSMLAHLNGIIFILTGVALLMLNRNFIGAFIFLTFAFISFSPYLIDIILHYDIFIANFNSPFAYSKTHFNLLTPFLNLSREHQRFFRNDKIIPLTLLFIFCLVMNFKKLLTDYRILTLYLLFLILFMSVVLEDKRTWYSTYTAPFEIILIYHSLKYLDFKKRAIKVYFSLLVILFVSVSLFKDFNDILDKSNQKAMNQEIGKFIPKDSWVIGPWNFIFNGLENYRIASVDLVRIDTKKDITIENLHGVCINRKIDYWVFNKYSDKSDDIRDYSEREKLLNYFEVIVECQDFKIIKAKKL